MTALLSFLASLLALQVMGAVIGVVVFIGCWLLYKIGKRVFKSKTAQTRGPLNARLIAFLEYDKDNFNLVQVVCRVKSFPCIRRRQIRDYILASEKNTATLMIACDKFIHESVVEILSDAYTDDYCWGYQGNSDGVEEYISQMHRGVTNWTEWQNANRELITNVCQRYDAQYYVPLFKGPPVSFSSL
jgi:hypothetical protein